MLAWAGLGIAMPNGRPAAKAAAKRTAPQGNPETALARAVADLLGSNSAEFGPEAEVGVSGSAA
jgi:hydroxymethylpyrimidine pyrophosphatase-like HAD family hydrolase